MMLVIRQYKIQARLLALIIAVSISILCHATSSHEASVIHTLLDSLQSTIGQRDLFSARKDAAIDTIRKTPPAGDSYSDEEIYRINTLLFDQYLKYQVDSAMACADRATEAGRRLGNDSLIMASSVRKSMALSMCSRFLEADDILDRIDARKLDNTGKLLYYEARTCLQEYYEAASQTNYHRETNYRDSIYRYLDPDSYSYRVMRAASYSGSNPALSENLFSDLLDDYGPESAEYAMLTNYYATVNLQWGNRDRALEYYILSAISDIRNATRETLSLQAVAMMLFEDGRYRDAYDFTLVTISDIHKSGISFRASTTYDTHSVITSALHEEELRSRKRLLTLLSVSVASLVILITLAIYIYRQMQRNVRMKRELAQSNNNLNEALSNLNRINALLNEKNILLYENNVTKQSYIAEFFDVCFHYIDKMEQTHRSLYKLAAGRSFDELTHRLKEDDTIAAETDALYRRFDSIFLKLYPTFVDDFNNLLRLDEKVKIAPSALLNRELRIYALMRLGITDSVKIAFFLRCSTSTVYNYRTRLRNRSIDREHFEDEIMKIKAAHDL